MLCLFLSFLSIYEMFLYDGRIRGCGGNVLFKYRGIKTTSEIVELQEFFCAKYSYWFYFWVSLFLLSTILGGMLFVLALRKASRVEHPTLTNGAICPKK